MKELFFWLICNTSIDNNSQTSNKEIREAFFKDYPELNSYNGKYSGLIGICLNVLYAPELVKFNPNTRNVLYNVKVHSTPVREIIIRDI